MSQTPRNPFDQPAGNYPNQPNQFPESGGQAPYQSGGGSNTWLWVLGIVGGLFLIGGLICCGGVAFLGYKAQEFAGQAIRDEIKEDPVVLEHIGEIGEIKMDFTKTGEESQNNPDMTVIVFTIEGDKGSGLIMQRTNQKTGENDTVLRTEDGSEYPLESWSGFDQGGNNIQVEELEVETSEALDEDSERVEEISVIEETTVQSESE